MTICIVVCFILFMGQINDKQTSKLSFYHYLKITNYNAYYIFLEI